MGSSTSQSFYGVLPGDAEHDLEELAVEFLTPDILERSWRSLEPSNDFRMPWERGIWSAFLVTNSLVFQSGRLTNGND